MASTIKVDEILDGNGNQFDGSQLGSVGKVLQVQRFAITTDLGTITTTALINSGLGITITPKISTSKLLVTAHLQFDDQTTNSDGIGASIYRDGVNLHSGMRYDLGSFTYNAPSGDNYMLSITEAFINSNSTSSTRFDLYVRTWSGTAKRLNGHAGQSYITVWEIGE